MYTCVIDTNIVKIQLSELKKNLKIAQARCIKARLHSENKHQYICYGKRVIVSVIRDSIVEWV